MQQNEIPLHGIQCSMKETNTMPNLFDDLLNNNSNQRITKRLSLCMNLNETNNDESDVKMFQLTPSIKNIFIEDQQHSVSMFDFVDDAVRKEIELETRQNVKQEFLKRFEIDAEQIRVDSCIQHEKDKETFMENISNLQDELMKAKEQLHDYKLQTRDLNNEVKQLRRLLEMKENEQKYDENENKTETHNRDRSEKIK
eukprot:UN08877